MPNVRAEALRRLRDKLERDCADIQYKFNRRKYEINNLANEQRIAKKQMVVLRELLTSLPQHDERKP